MKVLHVPRVYTFCTKGKKVVNINGKWLYNFNNYFFYNFDSITWLHFLQQVMFCHRRHFVLKFLLPLQPENQGSKSAHIVAGYNIYVRATICATSTGINCRQRPFMYRSDNIHVTMSPQGLVFLLSPICMHRSFDLTIKQQALTVSPTYRLNQEIWRVFAEIF